MPTHFELSAMIESPILSEFLILIKNLHYVFVAQDKMSMESTADAYLRFHVPMWMRGYHASVLPPQSNVCLTSLL